MSDDDLYEIADELNDAARLCDDECGEWWSLLTDMWPRIRDGASDEFEEAYKKELRREYERFKNEFRIEEITETQTVTYRTVKHESE